MKRIIITAVAAICAAFAFAEGYQDWYQPAVDFKDDKLQFNFWVGTTECKMPELALDSKMVNVEAAVELAIMDADISDNAKNAFRLAKTAIAQAMYVKLRSEMNRKKIESLGASIETIFQLTNAEKIDASGNIISAGKLQDGVRATLLTKKNSLIGSKNPASGGGSSGEGGEDKPLQITITKAPFNNNQFASRQDSGEAKQILKGSDALDAISGSSFPFSSGMYLATGWFPMLSDKDGTLEWKAWNGVDTSIIGVSAGTGGRDGKLQLKDWNGGNGGCELNLKELLTNKDDPDYQSARNSHAFLTRCKDGTEYKLHYMSVGGLIDSITPVDPDEVSIETHINDDNTTNICLFGVNEANDEAGESETEIGFIPYVDGGETLAWAGFSEFFNENVFTTDENGKIVLSGVEDAGENDLMLVTAKGTGSEQEVKVKKLDGNAFDAGEGTDLTLRGMNDTSTDYLFEDGGIAGLSEIPVKVAGDDGYQLEWRVWGGVDGGVFDASEDTDHLLSIVGWNDNNHDCESNLSTMMTEESGANRADHKIFTKFQNGEVHWVPLGGRLQPIPECDDYTVTTNEDYGASTHGKLSIAGVSDAETDSASSKIPYIPNVNGQDSFTWSPVTDFFLSGVFKKTSEGKIALKGLDDSDSDSIKVISVEGEDDEQTISALKFDKKSIVKSGTGEIEVANFKEGTAPVQGANFADILTNATTYANMYVMVRDGLGDGMTVKYAPLGKLSSLTAGKINPCATDDESITTNTTYGAKTENVASLYGWTTAADSATSTEPQVPYTDGEDKLKWKKPLDFFEVGQFDKTSEGKIVLKGLGREPESGTRFLSAEYDEEENATFKPMTLDGGFTEKDGSISLSRWDASAETRSLAEMLTNRENYASITIMGRDTQTDGEEGAVIKYYPLGKILADTIDISEPDEYSITTNGDNGAKFDGYLSICGLADAEADSVDEPYLAYVNGEDSFAWHPVSDLFNENVFKVDEDGKIVLSGVEDAGENDVMLVTAKGAGSSQEVKVKKLDSDTFDVDEDSDLTLLGFNDTTSEYLWEDDDIFGLADIPVKVSGDDGYTLEWRAWGGVDGDALVVDTDHALTIAGFKDGEHDCEDDLTTMLTDEDDADNRSKHAFLSRYTDGSTKSLHWVSVGDLIDTEFHIDAVSITTNAEDGAVTDGEMSLFGFATADEAASTAEEKEKGFVPFADGSGELNWAGMSAFFSNNIFDKTSDGRIKLRGVGEEQGKVKVLAVSGGSDDDSSTLSGFSGDGVSVDFGIDHQGAPQSPLAQLHKFDTAPSPYGTSGLNFADSLTNRLAAISGMSVPVRYNNGGRAEVGYIPMGKLTGTPSASVDNLTIESTKDDGAGDNDPEKLRIVGAKEATKGQLLKMGEDGKVEWSDFPIDVDRPDEMEEDEYPLYITAADPVKDEPAKIGINGWSTFDSPEGIYGAGNGKPVTYRFVDIKSLEADGDLRTIELTGYKDAGNYAIPFKDRENGLGWVAPPSSGSALLTMNNGSDPTATVLGNSVETETLNNKVTLNIKGFTNGGGCDTTMSDMLTKDAQASNRSHHQVLTRYSTGSGTPALHWVPMGGKVSGGGADVDDASITTNTVKGAVTADKASIYGFAQATEGQVPHKGKNNVIEWKKPSGGSAFAFYGNVGTHSYKTGTPVYVGEGAVTNQVVFDTMEGGYNTYIDIEELADGVKIKIGVNYNEE